LAAVKAFETAFGVKSTPEIKLLRRIFNLGQLIHSHTLHFFFLSFPDFLGISNDFDLVKKFPAECKQVLNIRDWALKLCEVIGGRATHPIASVVGGFKVAPDERELANLARGLEEKLLAVEKIFNFMKSQMDFPSFTRPTNFISLRAKNEYALDDGELYFSRNDERISADKYIYDIEEITAPFEAVKRVERLKESFMVGALARVNNNHSELGNSAKAAWNSLAVPRPCFNSFYNTLAQVVETIHALETLPRLFEEYLKIKNPKTFVKFKVKAGKGVGAIEAPRGTLYHYYEVDDAGVVNYANIITPTAQFLQNLEKDLAAYLPQIKNFDEKKQKLLLKTLIRAYDPCISCATH
jgi:coenzyme F420-reducing hydrogenase alpha subunit